MKSYFEAHNCDQSQRSFKSFGYCKVKLAEWALYLQKAPSILQECVERKERSHRCEDWTQASRYFLEAVQRFQEKQKHQVTTVGLQWQEAK